MAMPSRIKRDDSTAKIPKDDGKTTAIECIQDAKEADLAASLDACRWWLWDKPFRTANTTDRPVYQRDENNVVIKQVKRLSNSVEPDESGQLLNGAKIGGLSVRAR
jgi:hypothetical protein